jgi:hypothetical protein
MNWSDKLQEFQAEMYGRLIDFLNKNGNQDDVYYDTDKDLIYFKIGNDWISEYEVDIFDVVETLDNLGIKCTY